MRRRPTPLGVIPSAFCNSVIGDRLGDDVREVAVALVQDVALELHDVGGRRDFVVGEGLAEARRRAIVKPDVVVERREGRGLVAARIDDAHAHAERARRAAAAATRIAFSSARSSSASHSSASRLRIQSWRAQSSAKRFCGPKPSHALWTTLAPRLSHSAAVPSFEPESTTSTSSATPCNRTDRARDAVRLVAGDHRAGHAGRDFVRASRRPLGRRRGRGSARTRRPAVQRRARAVGGAVAAHAHAAASKLRPWRAAAARALAGEARAGVGGGSSKKSPSAVPAARRARCISHRHDRSVAEPAIRRRPLSRTVFMTNRQGNLKRTWRRDAETNFRVTATQGPTEMRSVVAARDSGAATATPSIAASAIRLRPEFRAVEHDARSCTAA